MSKLINDRVKLGVEAFILKKFGKGHRTRRFYADDYRRLDLTTDHIKRKNDIFITKVNNCTYYTQPTYTSAAEDRDWNIYNENVYNELLERYPRKSFLLGVHKEDGGWLTIFHAPIKDVDKILNDKSDRSIFRKEFDTPSIVVPHNNEVWESIILDPNGNENIKKKSKKIKTTKTKNKIDTERTTKKQEWEIMTIPGGFRQLHDEGGLPHKIVTDSYNPQWSTLLSRMPEINNHLTEENEEIIIGATKDGEMVLCFRQLD